MDNRNEVVINIEPNEANTEHNEAKKEGIQLTDNISMEVEADVDTDEQKGILKIKIDI